MISLRDVVTGFGNRDPLAEVWRRNLRGGGGGAAEITGVPPLRYIGDGRPLTDYRIAGNAVQDGTPSPDAPVDVVGCGVRTGNLSQWEKGGISTTTGADEAYRTAEQGGTCEQLRSLYIPCYGNANYVLHTNHYPVQSFISYYDADKNYISRSSGSPQSENRGFTTPEMARYMRAQLAHAITGQVYPAIEENQQYAITFGSTALPYEPYGYKLPPTVNGTEYPIYLGEVETTRRVKKQNVTISYMIQLANGNVGAVTEGFTRAAASSSLSKCNIAPYGGPSIVGSFYVNQRNAVFVCAPGTTVSEARILLSGAVIWYLLAEPETAIVNEPLMKIGDYADTVSFAQAGVTIPTENGENILDVPTEVPPSEITIKGGISSV